MTNEQVVAFVHKRLAEGKEVTTVSEELIDNCLAPDGFIGAVGRLECIHFLPHSAHPRHHHSSRPPGCDNMSAIIVGLLHGKTKAEWVEQLRSTVDKIPEHSGGAPSSDDKPAIADTAPTSTPATTAATAAAAISTPTAAEIDLA